MENSHQYHTGCGLEQTIGENVSTKWKKGDQHRDSLATRRASLPIIGAAQERAPRGKKTNPRTIRSFVALLTARRQESGVIALILARFYLCHLLPPYCAAHLAWNPLPSWFLIEIVLPVARLVNSAKGLMMT